MWRQCHHYCACWLYCQKSREGQKLRGSQRLSKVRQEDQRLQNLAHVQSLRFMLRILWKKKKSEELTGSQIWSYGEGGRGWEWLRQKEIQQEISQMEKRQTGSNRHWLILFSHASALPNGTKQKEDAALKYFNERTLLYMNHNFKIKASPSQKTPYGVCANRQQMFWQHSSSLSA